MDELFNPAWSTERRRGLRQTTTKPEEMLWRLLRNRRCSGIKFRRQCGIGSYIVDFFSNELSLVVELDGKQHNSPKAREYDVERTAYLAGLGIAVIRFPNDRIRDDIDSVFEEIRLAIILQQNRRAIPFVLGRPSF